MGFQVIKRAYCGEYPLETVFWKHWFKYGLIGSTLLGLLFAIGITVAWVYFVFFNARPGVNGIVLIAVIVMFPVYAITAAASSFSFWSILLLWPIIAATQANSKKLVNAKTIIVTTFALVGLLIMFGILAYFANS